MAATPPQQEFIYEQTEQYDCTACGEFTIVHKNKHVHEHRLCEDCYARALPFLGV